jgi:hypothetical protein
MGKLRSAEARPLAGGRSLRTLSATLLSHSLVLYIMAVILHRLWALLNSDVLQLIRRVH